MSSCCSTPQEATPQEVPVGGCGGARAAQASPVDGQPVRDGPQPESPEHLLALDNLHCINCVAQVERTMKATPGVLEARVNLTQRQLRVRTSPSVTLTSLVEILEAEGFPAREVPKEVDRTARSPQQRLLWKRLAVAGCAAGNIMLLSVALYIGRFQGIEPLLKRFFELVGMALALPVVFYSGRHFWEPAARALRSRRLTFDVPITVGLFATTALSVVSFLQGTDHQYFDTVAMFCFVLLVGRALQEQAMGRVRARLGSLLGHRPETVTVLEDGQRRSVALSDLEVGDRVLLEQGLGVPADGLLIEGGLEVDEASLTGEPLPRSCSPGDELRAGSVVYSGGGLLEVDAVGSRTVLSRLIALVEQAQERRVGEGRMSERVAALFSGAVLLLAALVFLWWLPQGLAQATLVAVSVLVITCPCALGLALPLAFWVAVRSGAENGVLVRDEAAFEETGRLTDLILDKTGTLTMGRPELLSERFFAGAGPEAVAPLVLLLEERSSHPFARALVERYRGWTPALPDEGEVEEVAGRGRAARWGGREVFIGRTEGSDSDEGYDIALVVDGTPWAAWRFDDTLRPEAESVVKLLQQRGIRLHLLSGDRHGRTEKVAQALGLDSFRGEQLPEEKAVFLEELRARYPGAVVGVLGDGTNDALALSEADVGVAMGHATAGAAASAPVLFLAPGLGPVLRWLDLGGAYRRTVRASLQLSALYNSLAIPAAALGWVSPLVAAIVMPISSLAVVVNSLRLPRRWSARREDDRWRSY